MTSDPAPPVPQELLGLADEWSRTFRFVADPTRLRLLLLLHYGGPRSATIGELAEAADVHFATASAALRQLADAQVVTPSRSGREVRYALTDPRVHDLLHHLGGGHAPHTHRPRGAP